MSEPPPDGDPAARDGRPRAAALLIVLAPVALALARPDARGALGRGVALLASGDLDGLRAWGADLGAWAPLGTTALMLAQAIAAPLPAVFVTWTNSWLFGPLAGGLLSIAQATLAATVCFLLARALGRPLVDRLLSAPARARAEGLVGRHGARAVLVSRLLPFVPFDPVSYVAGLTSMRLLPFVAATLVGQTPAGLAYAWLGQEVARPARLITAGACALLALLVVGHAARRALLGAQGGPGDAPPPGA